MGDNALEIILRVRDEATKTLNGATKQLDSTQKSLEGMSKSFMLAGGMLTGAGLAGVAVMKDWVNVAREDEIVMTQLNAVLASTKGVAGMTTKSISDLADSLSMLTGVDDEAIISGQSMLLTFTNIGKKVFPQATEAMLDMATAMNGGVIPSQEQLKGVAIQLGKALNDPIKGVTALRKVGVALTEAQQQQIETLVKQNKLMEAQEIILKELTVEFGGSARAAGQTFAGEMAKLEIVIGNVKSALGEQFLPILKQVVSFLSGLAQSINGMNPEVFKMTALVVGVGTAFALIVGPILFLIGLMPTLAAGFGIFANLIGPATAIILGVAAAAGTLYLAWTQNWGGIQDVTKNAIGVVQGQLNSFIADLKTKAQEIKNQMAFGDKRGQQSSIQGQKPLQATDSMAVSGLLSSATQAFQQFQQIAQQVATFIATVFGPAFNQIQASIKPLMMVVTTQLLPAFQNLFIALQGFVAVLIPIIISVFTVFMALLTGVITGIMTALPFIVGIITGFINIISGIINLFIALITGNFTAVYNFIILTFTGIFQVIFNTFAAIIALVIGFVEGVIGFFGGLRDALVGDTVPGMVNGILAWINTLVSSFTGLVTDLAAKVVSGFNSMKDTVTGVVKTLASNITSTLGGLASAAFGWGYNIIKNMIQGIKDAIRGAGKLAVKLLGELGISMGDLDHYSDGGYVGATGPAVVHQGEYVLSRDMLRGREPISQDISREFNQPITINANINTQADLGLWGYQLAWALRNSR